MRQLITFFLGLFFSFSLYAGGGITHMFIAEESIPFLDPHLNQILQDNKDAFLAGAHYPDSGYVPGTGYGEDSHWDAFIFTFADYIREKYKNPMVENPKLIAFLMGCAVHRMSDEIIHFTFYDFVSDIDFNGNDKKAHKYGDVGIDLLLNIDKSRWSHFPKTWWVPVADLLEVYHRMGLDQYTADQIIFGNQALSLAGYLERAISLPAYPYLKWRMPWTASNYYDWPQGGMLMDIQVVASYEKSLWYRLQHATKTMPSKKLKLDHDLTIISLSKKALDEHIAEMPMQYNSDGSVDLQPPVILNQNKWAAMTSNFGELL